MKIVYSSVAIYDAQKHNIIGVSKTNINYDKYNVIISASDLKSSYLIVERIFSKNKIVRQSGLDMGDIKC